MAIKSRNELKDKFKNGNLPTAQDFWDMFESMLNRKDDCFFGKWKQGTTYCHGAMVLYCGSLYVLSLKEDDECVKKVQEEDCKPCHEDSVFSNGKNDCLCSVTPPGKDARWKPLDVKVQDEDWVVVDRDEDGDSDIMYSNEKVSKIGISTKEPAAVLDINIVDKGAFLFEPEHSDVENAPVFVIRSEEEECPEVKQSVGQQNAWWYTSSSGYAFKIEPDGTAKTACDPDDPDLLLRITTHNNEPAVGIGTSVPQAALHAKSDEKGEIKLEPNADNGPAVEVANLTGYENYLNIKVENKSTIFRTKEGSSYFFRHVEAEDDRDRCNDESPAVAISPEGKVGIGTERPASHLDIVDKVDEKGRFRMSFEEKNPALAIINTRPREETNYLTIGVDNNRGAIVTDSPQGIEFKTGSPCVHNNNDVNINQDGGDTMMNIFPNGSVGIGSNARYARYNIFALDVEGKITGEGFYSPADSRNMKDAELLDGEQMLANLKKLSPIKFNWKNGAGGRHHHHHHHHEIGLRAVDVDEVFPQVVLSPEGQPDSIAYQNLVAVLVAAINRLTERVEELENRRGHHQHNR